MMGWREAKDDQIVCYCQAVDKKRIVQAINTGCNTLALIQAATSACTGGRCKELNPSGKCCSEDILKLIEIYSEGTSSLEKHCCCCK
jgi:NAD(P)H-nitrite reductase large subunit